MWTNLGEQRSMVVYLDVLYPGGHLRQAKVNALRERWLSRASVFLARIETIVRAWGEVVPFVSLRGLPLLCAAFAIRVMPSILDKAFKGATIKM